MPESDDEVEFTIISLPNLIGCHAKVLYWTSGALEELPDLPPVFKRLEKAA